MRKSYRYTSKSGNSLISELNLKTDILVISGESSATWAAWNGAAQGVKVVVVDKSYCGMSGVTVSFCTGV